MSSNSIEPVLTPTPSKKETHMTCPLPASASPFFLWNPRQLDNPFRYKGQTLNSCCRQQSNNDDDDADDCLIKLGWWAGQA